MTELSIQVICGTTINFHFCEIFDMTFATSSSKYDNNFEDDFIRQNGKKTKKGHNLFLTIRFLGISDFHQVCDKSFLK